MSVPDDLAAQPNAAARPMRSAKPKPSSVFGNRLRAERWRLKMSQADVAGRVAEAIGAKFDPSAVTRIETGQRAVRLDEAVAIAGCLGLPLAALLAQDPTTSLDDQMAALEAERRDAEQALAEAEAAADAARHRMLRITASMHLLAADRQEILVAEQANPFGSMLRH